MMTALAWVVVCTMLIPVSVLGSAIAVREVLALSEEIRRRMMLRQDR